MIEIPNMVMIGGNSRNVGKTTLACKIIGKLSSGHNVIGLKVTSVRPGEAAKHGNHAEDPFLGYSISEELNAETGKDTSLMLRAGANRVFYIRASAEFLETALLQFLEQFQFNQPIICESRSLREIITPGLFLMLMRMPETAADKDVSRYLLTADKVFHFNKNLQEIDQFIENLNFTNGKFI